MDYPTYIARGWQIGSGPVESACKTVVRLKGGSMRWGEVGADAVCHLRAAHLSDPTCWEKIWAPAKTTAYKTDAHTPVAKGSGKTFPGIFTVLLQGG